MPWLWVLVLLVGIYAFVKLIQGIRDFTSWYSEGRAFAKERKKAREHRRQPQDSRSAHKGPA